MTVERILSTESKQELLELIPTLPPSIGTLSDEQLENFQAFFSEDTYEKSLELKLIQYILIFVLSTDESRDAISEQVDFTYIPMTVLVLIPQATVFFSETKFANQLASFTRQLG